jgi:hypothetical protein
LSVSYTLKKHKNLIITVSFETSLPGCKTRGRKVLKKLLQLARWHTPLIPVLGSNSYLGYTVRSCFKKKKKKKRRRRKKEGKARTPVLSDEPN